jgi:predicted RNA-binding protein with PUA-like domain
MPVRYWLLKTEPETYSFDRLLRDRRTNWNDVRNYQARNYLREFAKGDVALIYHSGDDKAVVGVAEVVKPGYPDIDGDDGSEWVQVDLVPVKALPNRVPLGSIKSASTLKDLPLIRHTRLSVMPVSKEHYETILRMAEKSPDPGVAKKITAKKASAKKSAARGKAARR